MKKKIWIPFVLFIVFAFPQLCISQTPEDYYNAGAAVGTAIRNNMYKKKAEEKALQEQITNKRKELNKEQRKLDSLNRLIGIAEKWVDYNKKTWILDRNNSISFYEIDCVPNTIFLTLKIVEVDYLVFALRIEDPSSIKHRLYCDNVVIRYKTVYGDDVYRKTNLNLEAVNHSNTYLLDNLFDLPEDAIDETTLTISFTGTRIKKG
jgi:hypothetical protein